MILGGPVECATGEKLWNLRSSNCWKCIETDLFNSCVCTPPDYGPLCTYQQLTRGSTSGTPPGLRRFLLGACIQKWITPGGPGQHFLTKTVLIPSPSVSFSTSVPSFSVKPKLRFLPLFSVFSLLCQIKPNRTFNKSFSAAVYKMQGWIFSLLLMTSKYV